MKIFQAGFRYDDDDDEDGGRPRPGGKCDSVTYVLGLQKTRAEDERRD